MSVEIYRAFDELPAAYGALFQNAPGNSFFLSLPWFRNVFAATAQPGEALRLYGVTSQGGQPTALLAARALGSPAPGESRTVLGLTPRTLAGLTAPAYTPEYGLLMSPVAGGLAAVTDELVRAIAGERPAWDEIQFRALQGNGPALAAFADSLRRCGFAVQPYFQIANWYEPTANRTYADYSNRLTTRIRKSLNKVDKPGGPRFRLLTGGDLDAAIADYQRLYNASWKQASYYPDFIPGLIRAAAEGGSLRLGILDIDGEPAAIQVWLVAGQRATIFDLVFDEKFKKHSPGSMLSACLMRHVIDFDRVAEVDFGCGDDDYKQVWMSQRRDLWGLVAFNPRTFKGAAGALRHVALPRLAKRLRGWRPADAAPTAPASKPGLPAAADG
jgi:Acetyltransferase (GNAT) domain